MGGGTFEGIAVFDPDLFTMVQDAPPLAEQQVVESTDGKEVVITHHIRACATGNNGHISPHYAMKADACRQIPIGDGNPRPIVVEAARGGVGSQGLDLNPFE